MSLTSTDVKQKQQSSPSPMYEWLNHKTFFSAIILLPILLLVGVLIYYPAGDTLQTSFTNYNLRFRNREPEFIGIENYQRFID